METWKRHMPPGMFLRSEPYGSDMVSPRRGYDVKGYASQHGADYVHRLGPLSIETFVDYADWYTAELVPDALDDTVTDLAKVGDKFRVDLSEHDPITASVVVLAVGLLPFVEMPATLATLPSALASHVSAHHDLSVFDGKRFAVVGGGQSSLETLALLHERGVNVQVVMRKRAVNWLEPNPAELSPLGHIRRPSSKLCEGWHCQFWYTPELFRLLPRAVRITKARAVLGPAGAWWLRDRVQGVIPLHLGHSLRAATPHEEGVRLDLEGPEIEVLEVDHVIAGTGFHVDVDRLTFLSSGIRHGLATEDGYPVLDRAGRSTVDGLYFAGAAAAGSLGPAMRFIAGTHKSSEQLARAAARDVAPRGVHSYSPPEAAAREPL
jgi:thioredoxin reductase